MNHCALLTTKWKLFIKDIIHKTIINFYSETEIRTAKETFYKKCADLVHTPMENMRRMRIGKSQHNFSNIFLLVNRIPPDIFPTIVTSHLAAFPILDPDVMS